MINKDLIEEIIANGRIIWQKHALQRIFERNISRDSVLKAVLKGEIIKNYIDDKPFSSYLMAYNDNVKIIHAVVSFDIENKICYIITAYYPDADHFEKDMITRKK
ncbi:MAG: DUF4258 domain-containing protein [Spirochaetota bacterium]